MPTNEEIAGLFEDLAALLELKGDSVFKIRAYQRAARTIDQLPSPLSQAIEDGADLKKIPGIGKAISDKIHELFRTGRVEAYERVRQELPAGVLELTAIPGIGPKTAMLMAGELGISSLEEVEQAAADGRLASLPRMGKRAAENILRHLQASKAMRGRTPIGEALPLAERVMTALREQCPEIDFLVPAGSLRRWEETIGDIDLIGSSPDPEAMGAALAGLPFVQEVLVQGPKKTSVIVEPGVQVDLRAGEPESLGAMLQYFTGSKQHNIRLRDYANRRGLSLNEYGITNVETGAVEQFADEEGFYARLGLAWPPPELRTGMWELDAAQQGGQPGGQSAGKSAGKSAGIPGLLQEDDLRGDLHLHSEWSDGSDPVERMVEAAAALGYEYMALTDHSPSLVVANGLSPQRLADQWELLAGLQEQYPITILRGSEVDIKADGSLDYSDEVLAQLDVVVASVHSSMGQDRAAMTARIIKAMSHPSVTAIGHLTTRLLGKRESVELDLEAVLQAARDTGTALEINASPERLDLRDTHAFRARELGVPLVINSDSHHHRHLSARRFGVAVARRAWCEPRHILNTMPRGLFLTFIRTPKPQRLAVFDQASREASAPPLR